MSSPNLTISSNTTSNSSNNTNSPFAQRFNKRVSRQRISTEAPMDFVYQSSKPQTSVSYHYQSSSSSSSLPQTKPLRLIDLNGDQLINNHSSSSSCFNNHPPIQPQMSQSHKPNYSKVESMDWEPSPPTSVVENSSSDKDLGAGGTNSPKSQTLVRMRVCLEIAAIPNFPEASLAMFCN
ncbi:hypothetical protein BY996DRAFT_6585317 [Phakopsora pachyrhizi]|nr:hypothetical protein BY996DRAFT_6585317 [Phakopsora pachyrhizi]